MSNLERQTILSALEDLQRYYQNLQHHKEINDVANEYYAKRIALIVNLISVFSNTNPTYINFNL